MPPVTRADTTYRDLETGRDAAARRAWPSAYDALSSADAAGDLGARSAGRAGGRAEDLHVHQM
jgi:hypothetical protein